MKSFPSSALIIRDLHKPGDSFLMPLLFMVPAARGPLVSITPAVGPAPAYAPAPDPWGRLSSLACFSVTMSALTSGGLAEAPRKRKPSRNRTPA
jgi:hypothetical protein